MAHQYRSHTRVTTSGPVGEQYLNEQYRQQSDQYRQHGDQFRQHGDQYRQHGDQFTQHGDQYRQQSMLMATTGSGPVENQYRSQSMVPSTGPVEEHYRTQRTVTSTGPGDGQYSSQRTVATTGPVDDQSATLTRRLRRLNTMLEGTRFTEIIIITMLDGTDLKCSKKIFKYILTDPYYNANMDSSGRYLNKLLCLRVSHA